MTLSVKVAGVWKEASNVAVNVGGVWKQVANVSVKVGTTWKVVWENLGSLMTDLGYSDYVLYPANASAGIDMYANGTYRGVEGGVLGTLYTWKKGGVGSDYDVMYAPTSGTPDNGDAINTWLNFTTTRNWGVVETNQGTTDVSGRLYIRMNAAPQTVFSNTSLTLSATADI